MNSQDLSNILVAVQLMNQLLTQATAVSTAIMKARETGGMKLEDLREIVAKRDAAILDLDRAIEERENVGQELPASLDQAG